MPRAGTRSFTSQGEDKRDINNVTIHHHGGLAHIKPIEESMNCVTAPAKSID
jgi:hypothetical protein